MENRPAAAQTLTTGNYDYSELVSLPSALAGFYCYHAVFTKVGPLSAHDGTRERQELTCAQHLLA
jgi:hypothetical protein